jgi:hypothetical protein
MCQYTIMPNKIMPHTKAIPIQTHSTAAMDSFHQSRFDGGRIALI